MITPFSGLSLIIHLLIIGVAKVVKTIVRKTGIILRAPVRVVSMWDKHRAVLSPSISIFILVFVAFGVSASTMVAVKTGLREGAIESHREFIYNRYAFLQGAQRNFSEWSKTASVAKRDETKVYAAIASENNVLETIETSDSFYPPMLKEFSINHLVVPKESLVLTSYQKKVENSDNTL